MKPSEKKKRLEAIRLRSSTAIRQTIAGGSSTITTQLEYAKESGISNNRISLILNGQAVPMTWEILQICSVSKVSADFILLGRKPAKESAREILSVVKKMIQDAENRMDG